MQLIVRADFYSDGSIVPIGITDRNGSSLYINGVRHIERKISSNGTVEYHFLCEVKEKEFWLSYVNNQWKIEN